MKKIKVMHVITDNNIGGAGIWLLNFLKTFDREKFLVYVLLCKDSLLCDNLKIYDRDESVIIMEKNITGDASYVKADIPKFRKLFQEINPDIVHTHASFSARIAARQSKIPFVLNTKHCMELPESNGIKRFIKRSLQNKYCDMTVACSKGVKKSMVQYLGIDEKSIEVIYNGVELISRESEENIVELKKEYNLKGDEFIVGAVCRLEDVKDVNTLIEAADIILKHRNDIKFLIAGTGSLELELKEKVKKLGLQDNILFTGFIKDIDRYDNIIDVMVNSSKNEALGIAILECMRLGIPVIATRVGGVPEVVDEGSTGELFDVGDYKILSMKIEDLADNEDKYKKYSKNSIDRVRKYFSLEQVTSELEKIYIDAIRKVL